MVAFQGWYKDKDNQECVFQDGTFDAPLFGRGEAMARKEAPVDRLGVVFDEVVALLLFRSSSKRCE